MFTVAPELQELQNSRTLLECGTSFGHTRPDERWFSVRPEILKCQTSCHDFITSGWPARQYVTDKRAVRLASESGERPVKRQRGGKPQRRSIRDPEEQLVRTLYQEFRGPLLARTLPLTGNDRQWAEDVVQETLIRAWRNAAGLDPDPRRMWAWLLTVARHVVIDGRRRRGSRPPEVRPAEPEGTPVPDASEQTLTTMVVTQALNGLTAEHRDALTQTYLRDRTINEAAAELGVPPGTVKSRVHYALRALRDAIGDAEETVAACSPRRPAGPVRLSR